MAEFAGPPIKSPRSGSTDRLRPFVAGVINRLIYYGIRPTQSMAARLHAHPTPRSEATRAALVRSARELFGAKGFEATSTREIAALAGANIAAIAYHFSGKVGLRRACAEFVVATIGIFDSAQGDSRLEPCAFPDASARPSRAPRRRLDRRDRDPRRDSPAGALRAARDVCAFGRFRPLLRRDGAAACAGLLDLAAGDRRRGRKRSDAARGFRADRSDPLFPPRPSCGAAPHGLARHRTLRIVRHQAPHRSQFDAALDLARKMPP